MATAVPAAEQSRAQARPRLPIRIANARFILEAPCLSPPVNRVRPRPKVNKPRMPKRAWNRARLAKRRQGWASCEDRCNELPSRQKAGLSLLIRPMGYSVLRALPDLKGALGLRHSTSRFA